MKSDHSNGGHILAFVRGIEAISAAGEWTPLRHEAAWKEAVRLAIVCHIYGGSFKMAVEAVDVARVAGCADALHHVEVRSALAAWQTVGAKIPAMAWLRRRGYGQYELSGTITAT